MVLLVALEGGGEKKRIKSHDERENGLTLEPQPHMRVNADSEWERQCGREARREVEKIWLAGGREEGGGKLPSSRVRDA